MKRFIYFLLLLVVATGTARAEPQLDLTIRALNEERRLAAEVGAYVAFALLEEMGGAFDDLDLTFTGQITVAGDLGAGVLGQGASLGTIGGGVFGAPEPFENVQYPIFLADLLAGENLAWYSHYGVTIATNRIPWNYDPEGRGQEGEFNCVATATHECCHGQGFGTSGAQMDEEGNGFLRNGENITIWAYFLEEEDGTPLREYEEGSRTLGQALTSNAIFWGGQHGIRANDGERVRIYAPRQFNRSSIAHLSQEYEEEEVMVRLSRPGEDFERLSLGPRETAMFRDMLHIPFENESPDIANIEDQSVSEDDTLLVELDITDEDGDRVTLTVSSEREEITVSVTEDGILTCIPEPNWYGETLMTLIASDAFAGADTVAFLMTVESVNDAPEAFTLISPRDGFTEDDTTEVLTFRWRASDDADGDEILYGLVFRSEHFQETYETEERHQEIAVPIFPSNEEIRWHVWATDRTDTIATDERTLTIVINRPPVFTQNIEDTSFAEDQTLSLLLSASDPDEDAITYHSFSNEESIRTTLQSNRLTITPSHNWFGNAEITAMVSDGVLSDTLRFRVTVLPVNDAPETFSLLTPEDGSQIADTLSDIRFSWEASEDIENDSIRYAIIFSTNERTWQEETGRTTLALHPNNFPVGESIEWYVSATDGQDTVLSETWKFERERPNEVPNLGYIPTEFSIQNYPNPFNAVTTIEYSVPLAGLVHLTVYDLTGRTVWTRSERFQKVGVSTFTFDAHAFDTGVYILKLEQKGLTSTHKMTLLR